MKRVAVKLLRAWATPTGLACSGMALICGSIASNALLLQHGRHPAPLFATRGGAPAPKAATVPGDMVVQAVQQQLASAGYYDGPVDGVAGPQTRAAILAFERRTGLRETGVATAELITGIQSWAARGPRSVATEPPGPQAAATADPKVALVQAALARAAYGPLSADGVFGKQSHDAIVRFQLDQGMPLTGAIDEALVKRLKAVGAMDGG